MKDQHGRVLWMACELSQGITRSVGLFMPDSIQRSRTWFNVHVTISLPRGWTKSLAITSGDYAVSLDTRGEVDTDELSIRTQNAPISARVCVSGTEGVPPFTNLHLQSTLKAGRLHLETSNAPISGVNGAVFRVFQYGRFLTSRASISATTVLGTITKGRPQLDLNTTEKPIDVVAHLVHAETFAMTGDTIGAPLDIQIGSMPVDAKVFLGTRAKNSPIRVALPATYEGSITANSGIPGGSQLDLPMGRLPDPKDSGRGFSVVEDRTPGRPVGRQRKWYVWWGDDASRGKTRGQVVLDAVGGNGLACVQVKPHSECELKECSS
jgi:hypothetical protein